MKLKAIFKILTSQSFAFVTVRRGQTKAEVHTKGSLPDAMLIATTILQLYEALIPAIEEKSKEVGQEKTLEAIFTVTNAIQEQHKND